MGCVFDIPYNVVVQVKLISNVLNAPFGSFLASLVVYPTFVKLLFGLAAWPPAVF